MVVAAVLAGALVSCATPYQANGLLGGFSANELREDVYRVEFGGNGYTTGETAQTYWLYRCAELTLEKGYYGFEILSDIKFATRALPHGNEQAFGRPITITASAEELATAVSLRATEPTGLPGVLAALEPVRLAGVIIVPMSRPFMPALSGDIHLLKKPFEPAPPKTFAAATLKAALQPYINSDKCGLGNVCPHVHEYLYPKGKLQPQ